MSTLVEAFSIQLKNEDAESRKKEIEKELKSKDVSQLFREIKKDDIFSLKDSRSNIGKYIELLEIIAKFAEDHVNYQLLHKDTYSGDDETHEKWNNVMTQSYNKLDHAKHNKHDAELNNRLLQEEFLNDPKKMNQLNKYHESMNKGGKKAVPKKKKKSVKKKSKMRKKTVPKKKKTTVKKKSKMRKKTAKKYRK